MNPWDLLWTLLTWVLFGVFAVLGIAGILILAFAILVGLWRAVQAILKKPEDK
jgi:hypothetical protein